MLDPIRLMHYIVYILQSHFTHFMELIFYTVQRKFSWINVSLTLYFVSIQEILSFIHQCLQSCYWIDWLPKRNLIYQPILFFITSFLIMKLMVSLIALRVDFLEVLDMNLTSFSEIIAFVITSLVAFIILFVKLIVKSCLFLLVVVRLQSF